MSKLFGEGRYTIIRRFDKVKIDGSMIIGNGYYVKESEKEILIEAESKSINTAFINISKKRLTITNIIFYNNEDDLEADFSGEYLVTVSDGQIILVKNRR